MTKSQITLGLLWHSSNSDNLGVGALTASHIRIIEDIAQDLGVYIRFRILGWKDKRSPYIQEEKVDAIPLRARDLIMPFHGLYAEARKCDLIMDISAGDSFTDIYGSRRFLFNALSKFAIIRACRPLILSPQTIGPFEKSWSRSIAKWLMLKASIIVTRDTMSTDYLGKLGLRKNAIEATDVAFRLPYQKPNQSENQPVRVGLNISGLLFNGGYTQNNMFSLKVDYPALVRSILEYFNSQSGCEIHLISHVISDHMPVEDDYRASQKLAQEFPNVVVAPRFGSPSDAKSYIAKMDFFTGSRMHACIAAFSSGVPVLPIAYSRKFAGLFGSIGYPVLADGKQETSQEILKKVIDAYHDRETLKKRISESLTTAESKLGAYDTVLRSSLAKAAGL